MDTPGRLPPARTGAAAGHSGYYHEAVLYSSPDELLAVVLPFLLDGVAAGEPTLVVFGEEHAGWVRDALPADTKVDFIPAGTQYARPAAAIRAFRNLFAGHVAAGAGQIRVAGELPAETYGFTWPGWARYESAINHAYDEFPVWGICPYDQRLTPPDTLADVLRTHPRRAVPDGRHLPNAEFVPPAAFLTARTGYVDPIEATPPTLVLDDPSPAAARRAVCDAGAGPLSRDALDDLAVAVSETVTNAQRHGSPPVRVRVWSGGERTLVAVTDTGRGPADPYAGLLPAGDGARGGLGLWVTHQCCDYVAERRDDSGYTVLLSMFAR